MFSKRSEGRAIAGALLLALAFSGGFAFRSILQSSHTDPGMLVANVKSLFERGIVDPHSPVRLRIPKIGVNAAIGSVGLTASWAMAAPPSPAIVGWFSMGPRPGEVGSAVIAGHYGWKNGIPAAFDDLHSLAVGDEVFVEDKDGTIVAFVVREVTTFGEKDDASAIFDSNDGKAHLNLITCEGIWNKVTKSYSDRRVVFADRE